MSRGRLTTVDKYTIQGCLHNQKTPQEIAKLLNRSEDCINKYINGELNKIHETIAKIETEKETPPPPPVVTKAKMPPRGQAKLVMGRKTAGDKTGVAIMTPGASGVGDDFLKAMPRTISRSARGNICRADDGKPITE